MAKLLEIIGKDLYNQLSDEVKNKYKDADMEDVSDGKYVSKERFNQVNENAKEYKKQVAERDKQIKSLKEEYKDVEGLKEKVELLEADNKKKDEEYQSQIDTINRNNILEKELSKYSIKDDKASKYIKSLLDNDKLKFTDEGIVGLKDQMETIKKENDFLFVKDVKGSPDFETGNNSGNEGKKENDFTERLIEMEKKSIEMGKKTDEFFS